MCLNLSIDREPPLTLRFVTASPLRWFGLMANIAMMIWFTWRIVLTLICGRKHLPQW
ncbi:hypothetical protein [Nostoc sp.]|uniref:hypothetical protein n=1 Tax=Nostoc sp. TaxID=1180 RepID=UPI002FFA1ACF